MAKEKLEVSSDERDQTQRSFGFFGFSAIAHAGLLIAICLAPSFRTQTGEVAGTEAGATVEVNDSPNSAPAEASSTTATADTTSATTEVLLADAGDASAVELPATQAASQAPAEVTTAAVTPPASKMPESTPLPPVKVKPATAKFEKAAATKTPDSIADALKAARSQPAAPKVAKAATKSAEPEATLDAPTMTDEASDVAAPVAKPEQLVASNESQLKDEEPTAAEPEQQAEEKTNDKSDDATTDEDDSAAEGSTLVNVPTKPAKKDEAVPLEIAIPEKEAIRDEDAALLQASPAEKAQMLAANDSAATQSSIPSNATPIATVPSTRTTNGAQGPAAPKTLTTAPAGAEVIGRGAGTGSGTGSGTSQAQNSRGGGTGFSVPLGVPVRDARSLTAMIGNQKPTYPIADQMAGRQGTAVLVAKVKNDGTVENVTVEKSSGSHLMDDSAAKAFKTWRYQPGQEGYVRLPVEFKLAGEAKAIPAQLRRQ